MSNVGWPKTNKIENVNWPDTLRKNNKTKSVKAFYTPDVLKKNSNCWLGMNIFTQKANIGLQRNFSLKFFFIHEFDCLEFSHCNKTHQPITAVVQNGRCFRLPQQQQQWLTCPLSASVCTKFVLVSLPNKTSLKLSQRHPETQTQPAVVHFQLLHEEVKLFISITAL